LSLYALRDARDQALINLARTGVLQPQTRVWAEPLDGPDDAGIRASELPNGLGDRLFSQVEDHDDDHPVPSLIEPSINAAVIESIPARFNGVEWGEHGHGLTLLDLSPRRPFSTAETHTVRAVWPYGSKIDLPWIEDESHSHDLRLQCMLFGLVISENWHANTQPRCPAFLTVSECRAQVRVQQQAKTHQFRNMSRMRPQRARY